MPNLGYSTRVREVSEPGTNLAWLCSEWHKRLIKGSFVWSRKSFRTTLNGCQWCWWKSPWTITSPRKVIWSDSMTKNISTSQPISSYLWIVLTKKFKELFRNCEQKDLFCGYEAKTHGRGNVWRTEAVEGKRQNLHDSMNGITFNGCSMDSVMLETTGIENSHRWSNDVTWYVTLTSRNLI